MNEIGLIVPATIIGLLLTILYSPPEIEILEELCNPPPKGYELIGLSCYPVESTINPGRTRPCRCVYTTTSELPFDVCSRAFEQTKNHGMMQVETNCPEKEAGK